MCEIALNETIRVPSDLPTIQAALVSISAGDTILVAPGRYQEALFAPALPFVLKGDINPDSGIVSPPTINPEGLTGSDTMNCLRLPQLSYATIEDIHFSNGALTNSPGGMNIRARAPVILRRCILDSTRQGLYQGLRHDEQQEIADSLFDCVFHDTRMHGINALENSVFAKRCTFENGFGNQYVLAGDGSCFRHCHFSGGPSLSALVLNGDPMEVSDCTFGPTPAGGERMLAMVQGLGNVLIRNNTFSGNTVGVAVIRARGGVASSYFIEDNVFADNHAGANGGCIQLYTQDAFVPNIGGTIRNNVFLNCFARPGGSNFIDCDADMVIEGNRFAETAADEFGLPAISVLHGERTELRGNDFVGTGYALYTEAEALYAENNGWGHNSGPYHETLNPLGQGDTIRGAPVDFEPWIIDTTNDAASSPLPLVYQFVAFPNPFNSEITIEFVTTKREQIRLEIFALTGRLVETISDEELEIGIHRRIWNARDYASGIFFARLSAVGSAQRGWIHKLVLLK
jgi:hypothetical protein